MTNINNKIENKTIEETLNDVKNGIINNDITKEQAEMMIKKCDILIKKNKKNLDRMEKINDVQCQRVDETISQLEVVEHYWEEEIIEKMVMEDDREGVCVRDTIKDWFACDLIESDDNVYFQKRDDIPECIYFFDKEEDLLRGMAVRYDNLAQVIKELDEIYKRVGDRQMWHDRRTDMDVTVFGNWLIHEFEPGYCKYAEVIKRF